MLLGVHCEGASKLKNISEQVFIELCVNDRTSTLH